MNITERIQEDMHRNDQFPTLGCHIQHLREYPLASTTEWERAAKAAGRRARRISREIEEAHKKAGKSKLHFD